MTNKKKVATWHKNKTAPKKQKSPDNTAHWIESRARLTKILSASGISSPDQCQTMLPKNHDR